jgi:Tfp pilus assembly protein PilF
VRLVSTRSLVALALVLALGAGARAQSPSPAAGGFDVAGRATALALVASDVNDAAIEGYRAIIAADGRFGFDRVNLALAHLKRNENKDALDRLDEAAKIEPSHPQLPYLRGLALKRLRKYPEALAAFAEALKAAPDCREAHFQIGLVHEFENRNAEAAASFKKLLEHTPEQARRQSIAHGQAMFQGNKHLSLIAMNEGKDDEADRHTEEAQKHGGSSPPAEQALDIGPCAAPLDLTAPSVRKELEREKVALPTACTVPALVLEPVKDKKAPVSLAAIGWTTEGASALWVGAGTLVFEGSTWKNGPDPGPGRPLAVGDTDGDAIEEVVVATPSGGAEVRAVPKERFAAVVLAGVTGVTAALAMDQDHDGDLDVIVAGIMSEKPGLWTFQNQTKPGAVGPALALASHEQCGLTTAVPAGVVGMAAGDLDEANDLDLVAFSKDAPPIALLSKRQGRFSRATIAGPPGSGAGAVADLTGDGFLDIAYPTLTGVALLAGRGDGTFDPPKEIAVDGGLFNLQAADLDGDMRLDLIGAGAKRQLAVFLAQTKDGPTVFAAPLEAAMKHDAAGPPLIVDLDRDGGLDLILPDGAYLMNKSTPQVGHVRVTLVSAGGLANSRGIGSRIWVRSGGRVVRREVAHPAEIFALAGCGRADLVRVQWTNGVVQHYLAEKAGGGKTTVVESGGVLSLAQPAGLSGSCPYLYADAGRGLEFLTDVLAGAPLGLPGADGRLVPSGPREIVALPRGAWAPVRGQYRFRVTEEYREVTYLDHVRLWVVDHPKDRVPLANDGIGTAPDQVGLVHADRVEPVAAAKLDGRDVTALVAEADGKHLEPPRGAVQGLAPEHAIELTLRAPARGEAAWLVLTGFVYWTDAGLNTRLAQAGTPCAPPRLEVPDGKGGWKVAKPFVRFPAGRAKTALVDVSGIIESSDPRVRLVGSMRVYLDRVALATARTEQAARSFRGTMRIAAPKSAEVVFHGIAPLGPDPDTPPWTLDARARRGALDGSWIVPRGHYTKRGPVLPLLTAFDDRYVVMGPGDGVDLAFDVPAEPGAGLERDLFLEFAGWDKDAHPATFASSTVEPLPYRGMPEYGPRTVFPAAKQEELRKAHAEWNTRYREGIGGTQP